MYLNCTQIAAPLGVQANRRLNAPVEGTPQYKFIGSRGLNTSVLSSYDPKWGLDPKRNLTCDMVTEDMPTGETIQHHKQFETKSRAGDSPAAWQAALAAAAYDSIPHKGA